MAESLHNLASLERDLRNPEAARRLMEEALLIQREACPQGHQDLARGLNNFASFLSATGHPDEAEVVARESLAMKKRLDELELATSLNTLAGGHTQGDQTTTPCTHGTSKE